MSIKETPIHNVRADEDEESFGRRLHAYKDAMRRSLDAKVKHAGKFNDPSHVQNVELARNAIHVRFGQPDIYENHRDNKGKPFTVLKARRPYYSRDDSKRKKVFLAAMDQIPTKIEAKPNPRSGDYIVRIFC